MKAPSIENVFYFIGICFAIASIIYFSIEYLITFPPVLKTILLGLLTITFFQLANYLKVREI